MARIRSIKPEFWSSEQVMECSVTARLMFIGMWNFADDLGRIPLSVKSIKAKVFPSDEMASEIILGMIAELSRNGLLQPYTVDGVEFLQITGWHHQRIDKPQPAKYPAPSEGDSTIIRGTVPPDRIGKDRIGEEGILPPAVAAAPKKPVEKKSRAEPRVSVPEGFSFSQNTREYAVKLGFSSFEIDRECQRFIRHAKQNDRKCADWCAAADNWFDKAAEFAGKPIPIDPAVAAEALKGKFYAAAESPQLEAWDQYSISLRGVRMMRDRNNGWLVDSEWPPGHQPHVEIQPSTSHERCV